MMTVPESPLELVVQYYLDLLRIFRTARDPDGTVV
jgi:hypothetical protein